METDMGAGLPIVKNITRTFSHAAAVLNGDPAHEPDPIRARPELSFSRLADRISIESKFNRAVLSWPESDRGATGRE
jgi:hypothetical protein